jgi:hypothetical protein
METVAALVELHGLERIVAASTGVAIETDD